MKKIIGFFISNLFLNSYSIGEIPSLKQLCSKVLILDHQIPQESKKDFNQHIINMDIDPKSFDFSDKTIQDRDFSDLCLKDFNFTKSKLIKVSFKNHKPILINPDLQQVYPVIFHKTTFKDCDFSDADLKNFYFIGCKFKKTDFKGADISHAHFEKCKGLKKHELDKCILGNGIKFNPDLNDYNLIKLYSYFKKSGENEKAEGLNKIFSLIKITPGFTPYTEHKYSDFRIGDFTEITLKGFNLIGINFQNFDLSKADLQGAWLSEDHKVPPYEHPSELFPLWANEGPYQHLYQRLVNAKFPIFDRDINFPYEGVPYQNLSQLDLKNRNFSNNSFDNADLHDLNFSGSNFEKTNFETANLERANFSYANLKKACFEGDQFDRINFFYSNLKKARFHECYLTNVNLIGANLKGTVFQGTSLQGAWLSEDHQIPPYENPNELFPLWANEGPYQHLYQRLVNAQFPILSRLSFEHLSQKEWKNMDLSNADLDDSSFKGIHFKNVSFKGASLNRTDFTNCIFENCNLTKIIHEDYRPIFKGAVFKNVQVDQNIFVFLDFHNHLSPVDLVKLYSSEATELENTHKNGHEYNLSLLNIIFQDKKLNLAKADLKNLNLKGINLSGCNLEGADFTSSNLFDVDLRNANLKNITLKNCNLSKVKIHGIVLPDNSTELTLIELMNTLNSVNYSSTCHQDSCKEGD